MPPQRAYIGLGSNLNNPMQQLDRSVVALDALVGCSLVQLSPRYRSAPMGPQEQPDYINAVAELSATLTALALLDALQSIEQQQGRQRGPDLLRWGARTLDLDLLLYGDEVVNSERLQLPHPGLSERNFVLYPLFDIAPGLTFPDGSGLGYWLERCPREGLELLQNV